MKLLGRDHTDLGESAFETVGSVTIGITRGRFPKEYAYTDPNEDAVMAAVEGDCVFLAVADGHHGIAASHRVIEALSEWAADLAPVEPAEMVGEAVDLAARILLTSPSTPTPPATTLTVTAVQGNVGAQAGWGDSGGVLIREGKGRRLNQREMAFAYLGGPVPQIGPPFDFRLQPNDLLLVATDGLFDFLHQPWHETLARSMNDVGLSQEAAEVALDLAGEGGSGDNVAVASFRTMS